jgi:aspartate aminotransferase-like enzyme
MVNKLFIPGPTEVRKDILKELSNHQIGHRTKEFKELFSILKKDLKKVFYTNNDVLILTSSGSGFWEASIRSCVSKKVLHAVNGSFSDKWSNLSENCEKDVTRINHTWGESVKPKMVDKALSKNPYEAFCMVHNETSTGVASDLNEIAEVMVKYPNVIWIVDAISSLAGIKIDVDKLGIDICLASSQKALALPPGLAFASVSDRIYEKAKEVKGRGYYFDLLEIKRSYDLNQTPSTPSIPHLYALKKQLERIEIEGLENRFKRHEEMANHVRTWTHEQDFKLFPEPGYESNTVTCISNTRKINMKNIKKDMAIKGYSIDTGYTKLNERLKAAGNPTTFRIAHMGDLEVREIKKFTVKLKSCF